MKLSVVETAAAMLVAVCLSQAQSGQVGSSATVTGPRPLLLEKNEGEPRLWRPEPGEADLGGFILKVTPQNSGSRQLMLLTTER
jgi:hypothetical protein